MKKVLIVGGGAAGLSAWDRSGYHIDNCVNKVFRKDHIDKLESVYLFVCLLICTVDTIA